jgi:uncharacterized glyoxalase superfamily protein PhnB
MPKNPPDGYHNVTPQTIVDNAKETIDFLTNVFGAITHDIYEDGGRVVHSEVSIGDSRVMIADSSKEFGRFPLMTNVYVDDVDATYQKALASGATSLREPEDQFYGDRTAGVVDDQGNQWWMSTHIEDVSQEEMARRMAEMPG